MNTHQMKINILDTLYAVSVVTVNRLLHNVLLVEKKNKIGFFIVT